ncbi:MAG: diadenylate cyclase [Proteobacteria bacterium]|nr:diadenylate cyclase [Pseudomonadota bacterium]MBU1709577.1 diadenylate cyclase [Pseudomonadota bacterium]
MHYLLDWRMVLDILLITLLIYSIFRTLRATGTWKIAVGLTFTACVAVVARLLDLQGLEWFFSNFSQIALLALLIIFQPEIRRILERSFSMGISRGAEAEQIPEIVDQALFDLAEKKWGGLVVFHGEVPLQQWITEGTRIDALPSVPALLSLFDPNSPGHDGAILFEGNRINRFGVHLPLSGSNRLSNEYGTRHHAALGLAEKTDSLILAVSEERGIVTAFHDGDYQKLEARGKAAGIIRDHLGRNRSLTTTPGRIKQDFFLNFGQIVGSLFLAMILWVTVIQSRTEIREMFFTVPIEYSKTDKNIHIADKQSDVRLLIEGSLANLRGIDSSMLRVQVDLSSLAPGRHRINLSEANISVPGKLRVKEIQPDSFDLKIRKILSRDIPVKPQLIGKLPEGYRLDRFEVKPSVVTITADIPEIKGVATTPIFIHELRETTSVQCKIIVPAKLQESGRTLPDVEVLLVISKMKK